MASPAQVGDDPGSSERLSSNNPYRHQAASRPAEEKIVLASDLPHSTDTEKQVVSNETAEALSGPDNAPMVVDVEALSDPKPEPVREAGKEVVSSWQTKSQEESAPISMAYHEPTPDYESINGRSRSASDDLITTPTSIEPDDASSNLPARPEDRTAVGQLLSWIPSAPRLSARQMPSLLQPVVVPQLDVPPQRESVPFARCYSDALASHDISMRDFTSFLDGLAVAQAPNSALQGLKVFGAGVSFVPLPIIPLAGKGLSALATSGSGHSGGRARLYLERAKKEYFAPRGLRLSIIKDNDLNPRLQVPAHASRLAPLTNSTLTENLCKRRLEAVASYAAPLRFDVQGQDQQLQGVHKMARKHLEHRFKDQGKKLTKLREHQWRGVSRSSTVNVGWEDKYTAKMAEVRRLQLDIIREQSSRGSDEKSGTFREMVEELQEQQRALQILISERQMSMQNAVGGSKGVEAEMEEVNWSRRLKWIVIENLP